MKPVKPVYEGAVSPATEMSREAELHRELKRSLAVLNDLRQDKSLPGVGFFSDYELRRELISRDLIRKLQVLEGQVPSGDIESAAQRIVDRAIENWAHTTHALPDFKVSIERERGGRVSIKLSADWTD